MPDFQRSQHGMTLIELMIALVLGLLISATAISVFLANKQTFLATEGMARLQENARVAFEQMARDLREAGGNACQNGLPIANVLNSPGTHWWSNYSAGVFGYDGSSATPETAFGPGVGQRITGTDAIDTINGTSGAVTVVSHNPASARFAVNTVNHGISQGDIVMVCDFDHIAITQITNASPGTNSNLVHNTGTGTPGNCTQGLGLPVPSPCTTLGTAYTFGPNSMIAKLQPKRWYIGNNDRGGRSLFMSVLRNTTGSLAIEPIEVAEGVQDLQLQYLLPGGTDYVNAAADTNWELVQAVRASLTFIPPSGAIDGQSGELERDFEHVITLRNHAP